jgi:hypothetical protein
MLKIYAVKTPDCYYIAMTPNGFYYSDNRRYFDSLLFDGKPGRPSFHDQWLIIDDAPVKVSRMCSQPNINNRYRLKDESMESDKIPVEIKKDDIPVDSDYRWTGPYAHLQSLYLLLSDPQPPAEVGEEFEFILMMTTGEITEPAKMDYTVWKSRWESDGTEIITRNDVDHQLVDKLIFPSFLIHETPARFTSEQMYKIIRKHVQDNIDPKVATITSDYNFCFTVKKRVPKVKPYKYTVDVNNNPFQKRKRKPKYEERIQTEVQIECFQMTWSPENYRGYTPIDAFEARNEAELKQTVDGYLNDLMNIINEPMTQCPTCQGVGYLKGDSK